VRKPNILFEVLRKTNKELINEVDNVIGYDHAVISTVTILETYYGMFKNEEKETKKAINKYNRIHLDKEICQKAIEIMLAYPAMRPALPDCLLAATTIVLNAELFTFNVQDFNYIKGVKFYKPKLSIQQ
jgi:predicted nucleic acid-binding protein